MDATGLPEDLQRKLAAHRDVALVAGVLSYQHAATIEGVLRSLDKGLRAHFPEARALLVHSDAGSTDGTPEVAGRAAADGPVLQVEHHASPAQRAAPPAHGIPGADEAFRLLARIAGAVGARAIVLVGADLRGLPDVWVERLVRPVLDGEADLVAPLFARHVLDGTLTTCLLYPLTRALYRRAVRTATASELACTADLAQRLAGSLAPGTPAARAVALAVTTGAAATGARLAEASLGVRDAEPRQGRTDLGALVSEVVGAAFALAEAWEEQWREMEPGPPPLRLGEPPAASGPGPAVSPARMVAMFRQGVRDLVPIWEQALRADTLADLYPLADLAPEEFRFPPELWARVVLDFLVAWRFRVIHRDHLLRSLVPLYLGRTAALANEAAGRPPGAGERLLERQAQAFEAARADVVDRWA
jgi:hypothetical protein